PGRLQKPERNDRGCPEAARTILVACQPPSSLPITPPWFRIALPGPMGSWQVSATAKTCGTSSVAKPLLRFCSKGEMTPALPLQNDVALCALSASVMVFDQV